MLFSSVFAITEGRDMGPYGGALVCVFVGFWDRYNVSQLPCVRYYVFGSRFKILVRNTSPRGPMCFMCLIFSFFQDPVSCYFCIVLLPLGSEKW